MKNLMVSEVGGSTTNCYSNQKSRLSDRVLEALLTLEL